MQIIGLWIWAASTGLLTIALLALFFYCRKLKLTIRELQEQVSRNSQDIAGLCSAAIKVDSNLQDYSQQLVKISSTLEEFENQEQPVNDASQPYHSVIARIRQGATVSQLVQETGISKEEAVLLIRLHGDEQASH